MFGGLCEINNKMTRDHIHITKELFEHFFHVDEITDKSNINRVTRIY